MELQFIDISRDTKDHEKSKMQKCNAQRRNVQRGNAQRGNVQRGKVQGTNIRTVKRARVKARAKHRTLKPVIVFGMLFAIFLFCLLLYNIIRGLAGFGVFADVFNEEKRAVVYENAVEKPLITEDFLTVNPNSRPGYLLNRVDNIFVHYTANPGTSAAQNRSYFENLAITKETSASAHFIIGYEGEIIQCLPLEEIGYAVKTRNQDSISIECCYLQEDGEFTAQTYDSLVWLCAWLLNEYNLSPQEILRHYDEGGKKCPLYYVEHEDAWQQFLKDVRQYILDNKDTR